MSAHSPNRGLQDTSSIPKGRIGRFVLEREIGRGSVGTVYQFRDPLIGRKVAIKVLNQQLPSDQHAVFEQHFIQEARVAGRLNHPNIVTVYDADKFDDRLFIAMEYLEGKELRDLISSGHRFSYKQIADLIARVANALDYAHQQGVIHRDIKPANIFIVGKYTPKVLDFGIASASRQLSDAEASLGFAAVAERQLIGTPSYMSPEQTRAEALDARTDIFSLGIVLYQLLCGRLPFQGDSIQELLQNIEYDSPVPPNEIRPDVPTRLAYIAGKAMSKKPSDRYPTAAEMANDLNRYLAKERTNQIIATLRNPEHAKRPLAALDDEEKKSEPVPEKLPHRLPLIVGAAVAATSLVVFGAITVASHVWTKPNALAERSVARSGTISPLAQNASVSAARPNRSQEAIDLENSKVETSADVRKSVTTTAPETEQTASLGATSPKSAVRPAKRIRSKKAAKTSGSGSSRAVGSVAVAVTPWGEVFVDGKSKGVAPPLSRLSLPVGAHSVEIRNGDDHYAVKIQVTGERETRVGHSF
jgi:serine/threonine-protein kinase